MLYSPVLHPHDRGLQVSAGQPQLRNWQHLVSKASVRVNVMGRSLSVVNFGGGGLGSLYLGFAGAMAAAVPSMLVYFGVDAACKDWLQHNKAAAEGRGGSMVARLLPSTASAFASAFFRVPADVLKHRVQAYVYPSVGQAARSILQQHGLRGFYTGFGATLLRDVSACLGFRVYLGEGMQGFSLHWICCSFAARCMG